MQIHDNAGAAAAGAFGRLSGYDNISGYELLTRHATMDHGNVYAIQLYEGAKAPRPVSF